MKYHLHISDEASLDIIEAVFWYEEQRAGLSDEFEASLETALSLISKSPLGFQVRYKQIRIAFTQKFPYGIHFIVNEKLIEVIGIFLTSRDPNSWEERLKLFG